MSINLATEPAMLKKTIIAKPTPFKRLGYFALCILPISIWILREIFMVAKGPFWLGSYVDPSYTYLLNSLNLAFYSGGIGHTDHPGTPVQFIGALVLVVMYIYRYISEGLEYGFNEGLQIDVLKNPELYLGYINYTFLLINVLVLLLIGYWVYKKTRKLYYALIVQSIPFYSIIFANKIAAEVSAEPLLFTVSFLFVGIAFLLQYNSQDRYLQLSLSDSPQKKYSILSDTLYLGILSGLGLAIKLPFITYWIIGMVYIWKRKELVKYFILAGGSFFVFTIFSFFRLPSAFAFWGGMATHTGIYGMGESGIIKADIFLDNLGYIAMDSPGLIVFTLLFSAILVFILFQKQSTFIKKWKNKKYRFLFALYLGLIVNLIITGKHYSGPRYLLSAFCLLPFMTIAFIDYLDTKKINKGQFGKYALLMVSVLMVPVTIWNMVNFKKEIIETRNIQLLQYQNTKKIVENSIHFLCYRNSNPVYALKEGDAFARNLNAGQLKDIYGDFYYYNFAHNLFYKWDKEMSVAELKALKKDIYITGSNVSVKRLEKSFGTNVELVKDHQSAKTYIIKHQ